MTDRVSGRVFLSPYLGTHVELTAEREAHIRARHTPLVRLGLDAQVADALADPDLVGRRLVDPFERAFFREVDSGWVVVVVRSDPDGRSAMMRHWVVTAFTARNFDAWVIEWERR